MKTIYGDIKGNKTLKKSTYLKRLNKFVVISTNDVDVCIRGKFVSLKKAKNFIKSQTKGLSACVGVGFNNSHFIRFEVYEIEDVHFVNTPLFTSKEYDFDY